MFSSVHYTVLVGRNSCSQTAFLVSEEYSRVGLTLAEVSGMFGEPWGLVGAFVVGFGLKYVQPQFMLTCCSLVEGCVYW